VTAHPDAYENLLAGGDGEASLRDIWQNAVAFGNLTWVGDAAGQLDRGLLGRDHPLELDPHIRHGRRRDLPPSSRCSTPMARRPRAPVLCNALYLAATPGWLVGLLDNRGGLAQDHGVRGAGDADGTEGKGTGLSASSAAPSWQSSGSSAGGQPGSPSMSRGGTVESFYVRGSRGGGNFPEMITLAQEADVNRILFKHEVPVPRSTG